ncbi:MAG TPA: malate/lactate/ureidoglycolate dehydrogenase [Geminicoccaceae bacterium]|nr:malate/lactate/ureidoglycolate dehydrogenase [Geminicoccaceae bacterium]
MPILSSDKLHALSRALCAASGSAEREATLVADHLVEASLTGHDSHGVGLLPIYVDCVSAGTLVPNRHAEVVNERGAVLVIEGNRGYGQVIGHEAMELGMARARQEGVALLALRNSFHLGRIGHWAEQCARGGFASIHFVNVIDHAPLQAPYGGGEARFSTNPFCAALPGANGPAVLLDMATSKIAIGKARVARNRGVPVPEDSLLDAAGRPTRDPAVMFQEPRGALIAMGEHKGSGLAIVCELLAGALTGGRTAQPAHPQAGGIINNMLSVIVDPEVFGDRSRLQGEIEALIGYVKSARPRPGFEEVLVPGEPERRRRAERLAHGIELDERTWAEILDAARKLGLAERQPDLLVA